MAFASKIIYRTRGGRYVVSTIQGAAETLSRLPPADPTQIVAVGPSQLSRTIEDKIEPLNIIASNYTPFLKTDHYSYILPTYKVNNNIVSAVWANKTKHLGGLIARDLSVIGMEYSPTNSYPTHNPIRESYLSGLYNVKADKPLVITHAINLRPRVNSASLIECDFATVPTQFKTFEQAPDGSFILKGEYNHGLKTNLDHYFSGSPQYAQMHDKVNSFGYYDGSSRAEAECSNAIGYYDVNSGTVVQSKMAQVDLYKIAKSTDPAKFNAALD